MTVMQGTCFVCHEVKGGQVPVARGGDPPPFVCFDCEAAQTNDAERRAHIARLVAELQEMPFEEREAAIAALSEEEREAVWQAELAEGDKASPDDEDELGGEG